VDDGSWPVADWQETSVGVVWLSPSYLETLGISEGVAFAASPGLSYCVSQPNPD